MSSTHDQAEMLLFKATSAHLIVQFGFYLIKRIRTDQAVNHTPRIPIRDKLSSQSTCIRMFGDSSHNTKFNLVSQEGERPVNGRLQVSSPRVHFPPWQPSVLAKQYRLQGPGETPE